jgi:hypothetical protein
MADATLKRMQLPPRACIGSGERPLLPAKMRLFARPNVPGAICKLCIDGSEHVNKVPLPGSTVPMDCAAVGTRRGCGRV